MILVLLAGSAGIAAGDGAPLAQHRRQVIPIDAPIRWASARSANVRKFEAQGAPLAGRVDVALRVWVVARRGAPRTQQKREVRPVNASVGDAGVARTADIGGARRQGRGEPETTA